MAQKYIVGVDLGGTKIATAVATSDGKIKKQITLPTLAEKGPDVVISRLVSSVETVLTEAAVSASQVSALCIGVPGKVDLDKGKVLLAPNLAGWNDIPLKKYLKKHFPWKIIIENDANAATLGEYRFGAGIGASSMIFVTISTGVGAGIIINNELYHGKSNSSGEIGHMIFDPEGPPCGCGNKGCFEVFASGPALASRAVKQLKKPGNVTPEASILIDMVEGDLSKINPKTINDAANKGDRFSIELIRESGHIIGLGLVNVRHILDPEILVIGGGVSQIGKLLFDEIHSTVKKHCTMNPDNLPPIVQAHLGTEAGIMGTIALGM